MSEEWTLERKEGRKNSKMEEKEVIYKNSEMSQGS